LNGFYFINEKHYVYILKIGEDWYNQKRGHCGRYHLPPVRENDDSPGLEITQHKLICHTELGEHLMSYQAAA
jgi:hypothetical protein